MKRDELNTKAERALEALAEELRSGKSETLKAYLASMARFHDYSFGNMLLILSQRPQATCVAGFHQWKRLHRSVRRGEKGIAIRAPLVARDEDAPEEGTLRGFRVAYVFDLKQTEGRPLPEPASPRGDPREALERLRAFTGERGIALEYSEEIAPAQGRSSGGRIVLLPEISPAEEFSVLAHELAHELLHQKPGEEMPAKIVRETEAEAVAFAVSSAVGLEATAAASDYIQLHQGDCQTLLASLSRIQKTVGVILASLLEPAREETLEHTHQEMTL